jgi:hypothetical protein
LKHVPWRCASCALPSVFLRRSLATSTPLVGP